MASTVWRGYITFGLISIPVRLFRAARAERVGLRRLYRPEPPAEFERSARLTGSRTPEPILEEDLRSRFARNQPDERSSAIPISRAEPILAPVRQAMVRKETDEVLPEQSVVKGFEYEKDRFIPIEPDELKSIAPKTSSGMEIQEFVALPDIDPVYFETSYYVTPEEAGEKAYALLYRAMQTTNLVALAQFAMHSREHVVVLRPGKTGLLAHTMFYASEVRADEEYRADPSLVAEKELGLAEILIRSLAAPFEPAKYRDQYRERLESIIAKKVQGQPITPAAVGQRPAEVVDIADALRKSLANLKKPASSEQPRKAEAAAPPRARKASRSPSK